MKKSIKVINISEKRGESELREQGGEKNGNDSASQKETLERWRVELDMTYYAKLAQLAMREGCTPEELVARQIARLSR